MDPPKASEATHSTNPWPLFAPSSAEVDEVQQLVEAKLIKRIERASSASLSNTSSSSSSRFFDLSDIAPFITDGVEVLVEDEFSKCFASPVSPAWNWNAYLWPAWITGIALRYCVLFPLRLTWLVCGTLLFFCAMATASLIKNLELRTKLQRRCIKYYCYCWVMSWSGVIRYHGVRPKRVPNQIFVANHTTTMDLVVLQQQFNYAVVGQAHPGLVGFIQKYVLGSMGCLWFNRTEAKDRLIVAQKIKEHIHDPSNNPLLIFPEGVCVNNEYCVMFKKGAFELGAEVYPVAIKYNKTFVDAYWNSRKQSFVKHMLNLMTSWALVCDVWYLEPQTMQPGETPTQFANRVKALIARKAGLINVYWDGYLKYFQPSARFMEAKQRVFASSLLRRYSTHDLAAVERAAMEQTAKDLSPALPKHNRIVNVDPLQKSKLPRSSDLHSPLMMKDSSVTQRTSKSNLDTE